MAKIMLVLVVLAPLCYGAPGDPQTITITEQCDQGLTAFKKKDYAKAAQMFESILGAITAEQAIQFKQTIADIRYHLGLCYFQLKSYTNAVSNFSYYNLQSPDGAYAEQSGFGVAASQYEMQKFKEAATEYERIAKRFPSSKLKTEYLMSLAVCWFELEDDRARALFERVITMTRERERQLQCAQFIMEKTAEKAEPKEAASILSNLIGTPPRRDALTYLSPYIVRVADRLYEENMVDESLKWYLLVLPRRTVLEMYQGYLRRLERDIALKKRMDPNATDNLAAEQGYQKFKSIVKAFEASPDYTPAIWYRLGRVYFDRGEHYESRLLYETLANTYTNCEEAPLALYGAILCNAEIGKSERALALADQFTAKYPDSNLRNGVGYVGGEMMIKLKQYSNAITRFTQELEKNPNSTFADRMRLMIGNAHFVLEEIDAARTSYTDLLTAAPNGEYAEEATYRAAISLLYKNDTTNGMAELEAFRTKYVSSTFIDDASYRIGELQYSGGDYRGALANIDDFTTKYPETQLGTEALMLSADCHLGLMGEANTADDFGTALSNAVDRFRQLAARAKGIDQKRWRYAVLQEGICYRYAEDYPRVIEYFDNLLKEYPKDELAGSALSELADAYQKLGKNEMANDCYHEAIQRCGEDPTNDVADKCLTQYSQIIMRNAYSNEFVTRFETWREALDTNSVLRARIDAVLLDIFEQIGDLTAASQQLQRISSLYPATNMPAPLAVRFAERAMKEGRVDEAGKLYRGIVDGMAVGQPYARARIGLATIDLKKKNASAAKESLAELTRFVSDPTLMPAIIYGTGAVALEQRKLDIARKYFELLVSNREWRGEYTAAALFGLGDCERASGNDDKAHSYYQRIYVLYGAYKDWVAQAYVAAGMCLERLNKKEDARRTFDELLKRDDLVIYDDQVKLAREHADKLPAVKEKEPSTLESEQGTSL